MKSILTHQSAFQFQNYPFFFFYCGTLKIPFLLLFVNFQEGSGINACV